MWLLGPMTEPTKILWIEFINLPNPFADIRRRAYMQCVKDSCYTLESQNTILQAHGRRSDQRGFIINPTDKKWGTTPN
jgi:hypothetical protein